MAMSLLFSFFIFLGIYTFHVSKAKEPVCSKFSYEEQLLEKMIRTEIKVEMMVNEIKTTQDNVLSTLGDIKQTVAEFSDRFSSLKANITKDLITKGEEIKQKEDLFQKILEEARSNQTIFLDDEIEKLNQRQDLFQKKFDETRRNLTNAIDDQRNTLQEKLDRPAIAFYAHHVTYLKLDKPDKVIIFDNTFINEGAGYDTSTGIFTAPVGGLYQFLVHTCAYYDNYAYIGLVLEGKVVAASLNHDKDAYTCSTVGAVVRVSSGEKVWVKATSSSSNYFSLDQDTNRMNTFSGILINI